VTASFDRAEFTLRNVLIVKERATTILAAKLLVDNTAGKLKPDMPMDVE
jgi:HlyD family secretion protein